MMSNGKVNAGGSSLPHLIFSEVDPPPRRVLVDLIVHAEKQTRTEIEDSAKQRVRFASLGAEESALAARSVDRS